MEMEDNVSPGKKKRLTTKDIARLVGTSKSTVSRVLLGDTHVAPETRRRIEEAIKRSGYQPNIFARGLRGGGTGQIGVIGRWMESGFMSDVVMGLDEVAKDHGYHLLTSQAHDTDDYIKLWKWFAEMGQVEGLVLIAPPDKLFKERPEADGLPLVLCASEAPPEARGWEAVDAVLIDNRTAMRVLMEHLVSLGCRHIVHLAGTADTYDSRERTRGFEQQALDFPDVQVEVLTGASNRFAARTRVVEYLKERKKAPDAFMAFNDLLAVGILEALRDRGIAVPLRTAVTGFDDVTLAEFLGLTTVRVPCVDLGSECGHLLLNRIQSGDPGMVARKSVFHLEMQTRISSLFKHSIKANWGGAIISVSTSNG